MNINELIEKHLWRVGGGEWTGKDELRQFAIELLEELKRSKHYFARGDAVPVEAIDEIVEALQQRPSTSPPTETPDNTSAASPGRS
jgi:hypothetical protein